MLGPDRDHVLAHREFRAAAKCAGCDHVLFELDNDGWALVHLTWSLNEPGWPMVDATGSWEAVLPSVAEHARQHE
jgi:hypothetical protein